MKFKAAGVLATGAILASIFGPSAAATQKADEIVIPHNKIQVIDLRCDRRQVPEARTGAAGAGVAQALDQEQLLLAGVRNKPFPKKPLQSLGWMELNLRSYSLQDSVVELKGPAQMAVMRLASLADNDYTIAAQMAYGIHMRQGIIPVPYGTFIGRFIMTLTESSHHAMENTNTNLAIDKSFAVLEASENMSAAVKAYGRWAVRGFAYDDMVAVDTALAGVCMSAPTAKDLESLRKAIKISQYDPGKNYAKPLQDR